jgi:acetyl-CoA carboxylase carboxyl transferase subunit alpha
MVTRELDFERPVLELERQIDELRRMAAGRDRLSNMVSTIELRGKKKVGTLDNLEERIADLEGKARKLKQQIFSKLNRWQIVHVARHPDRPYALDYVQHGLTDWNELHGDRRFAEDPSIVGGLARLQGEVVMVIGHQKGRDTRENVARNFGMPRPEGYRKALRLMQLADRFGIPILTLIDTPGAYPGIDAEERGQSQAIAEALEGMAGLGVPVVAVVTGEGGSGGALAIGVANRILMLEYGIYSVISPEGCASILFKDASYAERASDALKLTAPDLVELGIVDEVVPEPLGGAHRDHREAAVRVMSVAHRHFKELARLEREELEEDRYRRFRDLGVLGGEPAPRSSSKGGEAASRRRKTGKKPRRTKPS